MMPVQSPTLNPRVSSFRAPAVLRAALLRNAVRCAAFSALLLASGCYTTGKPPRIAEPAPNFVVQDGDRKVDLAEYKKTGKVLIVNFWATWCPPCVEELPSLVAMQQQMGGKVTVIAVSIDEDESAYHAFLQQHGVNLLTVRDPEQKSPRLYGTTGWPESFVVDRNGVMQRKFIGAVDWTSPEVLDYLNKM